MQRGVLEDEDIKRLRQLRGLVRRARRGPKRLKDRELGDFPRFYRHACTTLARLEARADDPRLLAEVRRIVGEAHGLYYREGSRGLLALMTGSLRLFLVRSPRAVREEWRLAAFSFAFLYGLALLSWFAVSRDLDLASSLLDPAAVEAEIEQLESLEEGESFRGNFTFGLGESPLTSGWIMVHNMGVGVLFFTAALVPPFYLYLLATNALMLGTYTAVAGHWGQAGSISSILWCHGVLEIQALVLAGTAGLCLVRAWIRPGPWSRRHAMHIESRKSWLILAPVFPMLFAAGLIEGFVSPLAPLGVRLMVAVGTGVLLVLWAVFCGRGETSAAAARPR
ncbi:MAG: stage II sporulation protein M [Planctomycetota bacterium]|nr:stage II sporulation protein M [Planctomycetota bacterium]